MLDLSIVFAVITYDQAMLMTQRCCVPNQYMEDVSAIMPNKTYRALMPNNLRITILIAPWVDNRILRIRFECIPIVVAESDIRRLVPDPFLRIIGDGVECNDTVVLVGEHAGVVVGVDDRAAAEDVVRLVVRPEGDLLVRPVVEIW